MEITKKYLTELTYEVNGAAIEVHKFLGPGLLKSVYHKCMKRELTLRGISHLSEMPVPINYKDLEIETDLRCDLFVENTLVVELKAVQTVTPLHNAQLLSYMKLLEMPKGVMYNFHCANLIKEGQKTFVNEYYRMLED